MTTKEKSSFDFFGVGIVYILLFPFSPRVQVEFFEPFWDSGEARVGELGARGWKAWMLQQERGGWLPPPAGKIW